MRNGWLLAKRAAKAKAVATLVARKLPSAWTSCSDCKRATKAEAEPSERPFMHEPAHGTLEVGKPKIKKPSGDNERHPKPEQSCSLEMICTRWPFLPASDQALSISVHAMSSQVDSRLDLNCQRS